MRRPRGTPGAGALWVFWVTWVTRAAGQPGGLTDGGVSSYNSTMITEVLDKNLVTIPEPIAAEHGIKPGSRLDWKETDRPDVLAVKILPDYAALATSLMGAGRKHLKPGADPVSELVDERVRQEEDRRSTL